MESESKTPKNVDEFVELLKNDLDCQRYWFQITSGLKQGKIIYYLDNVLKRAGHPADNVSPNILQENSKAMFDFLLDHKAFISTLMLVQGLRLRQISHELFDDSRYGIAFFVEKDTSLLENKHIISSYNSLNASDGFILGLLMVKTNIGNIFVQSSEFVDNLIMKPQDYCSTDINHERLFSVFDMTESVATPQNLAVLKSKIEARLQFLSKNGFISEIRISSSNTIISIAPGAWLWEQILLNSTQEEKQNDD